jgi:hypothetical protein
MPLRNGPAVPESVVVWLMGAEDRGLTFTIRPDGRLLVRPRAGITAEDDRFLREHRDVLLACVAYIDHQERNPV